jgi:hypothetical protein
MSGLSSVTGVLHETLGKPVLFGGCRHRPALVADGLLDLLHAGRSLSVEEAATTLIATAERSLCR